MAYCSGCEKRHDSRDCPYKGVVVARDMDWMRYGQEASDGDDED